MNNFKSIFPYNYSPFLSFPSTYNSFTQKPFIPQNIKNWFSGRYKKGNELLFTRKQKTDQYSTHNCHFSIFSPLTHSISIKGTQLASFPSQCFPSFPFPLFHCFPLSMFPLFPLSLFSLFHYFPSFTVSPLSLFHLSFFPSFIVSPFPLFHCFPLSLSPLSLFHLFYCFPSFPFLSFTVSPL